jgi:hypothetical protein
MGLGNRIRLGVATLAAVTAIVAWACADGPEGPTWALAKPDYDSTGSAGMLLPSNDTRVNLYLLLADRRGAQVHDAAAKAEGPPIVLFPWKVMAAQALGREPDDAWSGSRCQTQASGSQQFTAAVQASGIPADEKQLLIAARQALAPEAKPVEEYSSDVECRAPALSDAQLAQLRSPAGQAFAAYLKGTQQFYAGEFDAAAGQFRSLAAAPEPWVRETALYMVGRTLLNGALNKSFNEYGDLQEPAKRDVAGAEAAGAAFQAYLAAYPSGRYAGSARGLMRRVHYLAGDEGALAADLGEELSSNARLPAPRPAIALVTEADTKLPLPTNHPRAIRDPLLLAVVDLHRMRQPEDASSREWCCGPAITSAEIEAQRPLFGNDTELYDYVRAADAYFVRHQPAEVVRLIPDAAHQQRFTYLQFSRQMLRGMALQDLHDGNSRAFWLSLFPGAVQPYQRPAVELALAMHDEKAGRLDLVFAPNSEVRHPIIRQLLLEHVAGPDILRRQASSPSVPQMEREVALYQLLGKELRRGFYRDFLADVRLIPADAKSDTYYPGATWYDPLWSPTLDRPPVGVFGAGGKLGKVGCPPLLDTATALAADPTAVRPRLCLAEFFRNNGFDSFDSEFGFDEPIDGNGLASTRPLFPAGTPYARLEVYKAIMNDPRASADDRAFALNRAIRCYAPSGNNSCSGTEVEEPVRHAWFNRLKSQYPNSSWAKDLKFYW